MSYNRGNLLKRVIDIQTIYREYSKHFDGGCTDKWIFENKIYPVYRISRSRFYEYLRMPAKRQLKDLQDQQAMQPQLFNQHQFSA